VTDPNINIAVARLIIRDLIARGVTCFVISPGSRSAPLVIAAHDEIESPLVIIDERAAAYYALGYARASGSPAVVITTSGTAAANLYPAMIEASQSRIPLIALTADRPAELQNCGANQTIDQTNIFGSYAAGATLEAPDSQTDPMHILEIIGALWSSIHDRPLHLNCRFREPLSPASEPFDTARWRATEYLKTGHRSRSGYGHLPDDQLSKISEAVSQINNASQGLIVVGPMLPYEKSLQILDLAEKLNWPVAVDILSQLRSTQTRHDLFCHYDLYIESAVKNPRMTPDLIIHFGGLPTSRRLNQFLLSQKGTPYIKIQPHQRTIDPDHLETMRIEAHLDLVLERLMANISGKFDTDSLHEWQYLESGTAQYLQEYYGDNRLTEISVPLAMGRFVPSTGALFLSNSMPVRDADSFMGIAADDTPVGCNRGVSGIDGVIASACGFAAGCERPTTLLIGDTAFLHDLGSLAVAAKAEHPVIIVVVNNNGGGIFSFLPIADFPELFEPYFAVSHGLTFTAAATQFSLPYYRPTSLGELETAYQRAIELKKSAVIEIVTDRKQNRAEHDNVRAQLKTNLFPDRDVSA